MLGSDDQNAAQSSESVFGALAVPPEVLPDAIAWLNSWTSPVLAGLGLVVCDPAPRGEVPESGSIVDMGGLPKGTDGPSSDSRQPASTGQMA
jgi:hypothetical protein